MFNKKTVKDVDFEGQVVLVRADYNVPMKDGKVVDDLRIRENLPTLEYLRAKGAEKIVVMSHMGRPEGKRVPELSLRPISSIIAQKMKNVKFVEEVSGPEVEMALEDLPEGGILVLENLRFFPEEEENSEDFMREIVDSTHAELFVQDGFAVVHRAHASTEAITKILPSVAGLLVAKEVGTLTKVLEKPERPLVMVIGGAKVEDKKPLVAKFLDKAEKILVGGKIAVDLDGKVEGLVDDDMLEVAREKIYVAEDFDEDSEGAKLDIGPLATGKMVQEVAEAKTVIWNGCLGKVEDPAYATASVAMAQALGRRDDLTSVICGGDTTGFALELTKEFPELKYSLVSTGGGAALELLSGEKLPGVEALEDL